MERDHRYRARLSRGLIPSVNSATLRRVCATCFRSWFTVVARGACQMGMDSKARELLTLLPEFDAPFEPPAADSDSYK